MLLSDAPSQGRRQASGAQHFKLTEFWPGVAGAVERAEVLKAGRYAGCLLRRRDAVCERTGTWLDGLQDLPFDGGRLVKLRRAVEDRRRRLGARG